MNEPSFYDGGYKTNKLSSLFKKKQVNKFIRVKIVIVIDFWDEKVNFILFYVKDVNKTVPYYQY